MKHLRDEGDTGKRPEKRASARRGARVRVKSPSFETLDAEEAAAWSDAEEEAAWSDAEEAPGYVSLGGSYEQRRADRRKKKLKTWQKVSIGLGIPLAIILVVVIGAFAFVKSVDIKLSIAPEELGALQQVLVPRPEDPQEPYYILVLGSDAREESAAARSDTIMLCRFEPESKVVSVLSIPRDTRVELESHGTQKINAAMAYGGPAGAVSAVSDFVGVKISHVVMINFNGFAEIVDRLGGVTIDVPYYTSYEDVALQPGVQVLDGKQALTFVRCRDYALGDFQRVANQQAFLKVVAKEITRAPITEIPGLLSSLAECTDTDLDSLRLLDLASAFQGIDIDTSLYTGQVPSTTETIGGVSYAITTEDAWATVREKYVNGTVPFVDPADQPTVDANTD
jgi:LCP family protein required for cell wall assembly